MQIEIESLRSITLHEGEFLLMEFPSIAKSEDMVAIKERLNKILPNEVARKIIITREGDIKITKVKGS